MPPSYARVEAAVNRRIAASAYTLTLYYGAERPTVSGVMPRPLPVAPLVAIPNPTKPTDVTPPERAFSVSMPCLFLELSQLSDARRAKLHAAAGGWAHDARGLARVRAEDLRRPQGGLYVEGATYAEINGMRYQVLGWSQSGGSGSIEGSYYVQVGQGMS